MAQRATCFVVTGNLRSSSFSRPRISKRNGFQSRVMPRRRVAPISAPLIVCGDIPDDPIDTVPTLDEGDQIFVLESSSEQINPARGATAVRAPAAGVADAVLVGAIVAVVYGLAATTRRFFFSTVPYTALVIDTSLRFLPSYALQSVTRMLAGYIVSLVFSLVYAYIAYRVSFAAQALMLVCSAASARNCV